MPECAYMMHPYEPPPLLVMVNLRTNAMMYQSYLKNSLQHNIGVQPGTDCKV